MCIRDRKDVEQTTSYPKPTVHKSYFTNEEGYLVLPRNLKPGNYRIEEVTAPDGYTISKNYVTVAAVSYTHLDVYKRQLFSGSDKTKINLYNTRRNSSATDDIIFGK